MKRKIRIKQSVQQAVIGVDMAQEEDSSAVAVFTDARTGKPRLTESPPFRSGGMAGIATARVPHETLDSLYAQIAQMGASAADATSSFQALSAAIHRPRHSFAMDIAIEREYRTLETLVYLQVRISGDDPSSFSAVARIPDERLNRNSSSFLNEETVYRLHDAARDLARYIGFWGIREAMLTYRPSGVTAEIARCVLDLANRELRG